MSIIKHKIVQYVTDRPGEVVYKNDIMTDGGFTASQVTSALLSVQRDSPIGSEIQTIVAGNAWRYVPKSTPNGRVKKANLSRTLVGLIREYFQQHPSEVVSLDDLVEYTGRTTEQVKVGVNNARNNHPTFRRSLETVVAGNLWRYVPPPVATPQPATAPSVPVASVPTSPVVPTQSNDSARLFEEVGSMGDDQIVIRDSNGVLYRAVPLT